MSDQDRPDSRREHATPVDPATQPDPQPGPQSAREPSPQAFAMVDAAADSLRAHHDPRWVEISDRVLSGALRATRRSYPIQAMTPTGPVHIAEQVLITYIRDAVQDDVPDAALLNITIDIVGRDTLAGVTLALTARYGVELLPVADQIRDLTAARLNELLGPVEIPVTVDTLHVHFADVTDGDPHHHDPWST